MWTPVQIWKSLKESTRDADNYSAVQAHIKIYKDSPDYWYKSATPRNVYSGESIFNYEYLLELEAKIGQTWKVMQGTYAEPIKKGGTEE